MSARTAGGGAGVIRLLIAYDGTDFHGWAAQPATRTVQGALEDALERLVGFRPSLSVAGRTDAGVHAWGQVVSFEVPSGTRDAVRFEPGRLQRGINAILAPEVVIRQARRAPRGFDARFSASAREYVFRIDTGPLADPFTARFVWHRHGRLLSVPMRAAARDLVGEHDFASFCRPAPPPAGTVRRLERLSVEVRGERLRIRARADAFCHQMVRSLVGTLVAVGEGRMPPDSMPMVLRAARRSAAGPVAPPHGLTLERVRYGPGPPTFDAPLGPQVDLAVGPFRRPISREETNPR